MSSNRCTGLRLAHVQSVRAESRNVRPGTAHYTLTSKPARQTAAVAAALARIPYRTTSSSADSAPLSSAAARAAQPVSVISVPIRSSILSFVSPPVVGGGAPAGGGATRAARPSSPNGLPAR
eukprot:scaffold132490_cov60-Phaeocystis_antarctica.AAC.1